MQHGSRCSHPLVRRCFRKGISLVEQGNSVPDLLYGLKKIVLLLLLVPGCVVLNLNKMKGVVRYKPLF